MILRELFKKHKAALLEGGNLEIPNPKFDPAQPESELNPKVIQAQEIQLAPTEISDEVQDRTHMVGVLTKLFTDINTAFNAAYKKPLWNQKLIDTAIKDFMAGSSQHFFDLLRPNPHFDPKQPESEHNPKTIGISDEEFKKYKPKVGDIDIQCNQELQDEILDFLNNNVGRPIGNETLIGSPSQGNEQYNTLWQLANPPIKVQIDFEYGRYAPETNKPDEWTKFSHSSSWEDIQQNIKGVFHKYIYRALAKAVPSEKYIAKLTGLGKKRAMAISGPITDANFSFAVASKGGGGIRAKYKPYIDPETNQPKVIDGIPVMEPLKSDQSEYEQNLNKQFQLFFGRAPQGDDRKLQDSFVGTLELMNKYLDDQAKKKTLTDFLDIVFEPGAQMITKDDPARDYDVKFAAVNAMLTTLGLEEMRPMAEQMAKVYAQDYQDVDAFKKANPNEKQPRAAMMKQRAVAPTESIEEADEPGAQVKAQLRKGMPHLHDLKPLDLLDLLDEIHDGNGKFKLQNMPLNVKVDGFGGRFGKNADGKPFMGTSRTEPRYQAGFVAYHQKKGTTDPEILGRAKLFDDLFNEMMKVVKLVDGKLGPDFLINKQVTCEVLYLPFATETPEGKLKFVGIHYDKLPEGVQLALVPFRVVDATTGEDLPDANQVVTELTSIGQAGSVMFIDNSLTQNEALDVTAMVPPLENLEMFKAMLQDKSPGSLKRKQEVAAALEPVKVALEKAIIEDPNIIGKDKLGQDYEGIVINSRMGPIKVTSTEQRGVISAKNAAKKAAWAEQPRENNVKTAVVAIGSFAGHIGHQELFKLTQDEAAAAGGDAYLFIGNAEGKDDPIPIPDKVKTWHMLYPQYAKNISAVTHEGGTLIQKIKHELINPLPGKSPRYDNIIIMVGEDRAGLNMPAALMKAVNKFPGYEHVKVTLKVTPRGTGVSFTNLRNALKTKSPEEALADWTNAFNGGSSGAAPLPADWIKHLMDVSRKGMGIQMPQQPQTPPVQQPAPVAEQRLFNALVRPRRVVEEFDTDEDKEQALQFATQAHAGQTRSGGAPYISHPTNVANSIEQYKQSHNLDAIISAALLHDTVEDTHTTHEDLEALFGGLVASLVQELTSDKEKIKQLGKAQYLSQKMATMSSYALVIKLADRLDNVQDIATAKTPEWRERYKNETEQILNYIESKRVLSGTHRKFIQLIRNKLGEINDPQEQGVAEGEEDINHLQKELWDLHKEATGYRPRPGVVDWTQEQWNNPEFLKHMITKLTQQLFPHEDVIAEGPSLETTLRAVINDIGEPVLQLYSTMKNMAKQYVDRRGDLKGFQMVAAGAAARWYNNFYFNKLGKELRHLTQQAPRYSADLNDLLGKLPKNFNALASELPEILEAMGRRMGNKELARHASIWQQARENYDQYLGDLELQGGDDWDEEDPEAEKRAAQKAATKDRNQATGKQMDQAEQIVNNVLSKLPSKVAGDIRNAIARAPNKIQALQAELQKRGVKAPMAEGSLGTALPWPEVVNKVNSAMKAMGWKGTRKADGTFMFSTRGQESDDQYYTVIIDNAGEGFFTYALGTIEEGDPRIGEQESLPNTEASVSELMNAIRDGFGLSEQGVAEGNDWNGPLYDPTLQKGKPTKAATAAAKAEADYRKKQKAFQKPTKQQGVGEAKSAALRLAAAIQRTQGRTAAAQKNSLIPSSIPKKDEPKKDEKVAEKMLLKSAFTGSSKNKLGSAGQWKNTGPSKNRAARAGDLVGGSAQESINKTVQWKSLGEEFSVKDRMDIFEKFHAEGQLLESDEHYIKYFNNLNHYLINPTIGGNYLVVPLVLIQNKLRLLDTDLSMLEFVDKQGDSVIFKTAKGQIIKYPSDQQSEVGIYKTFMFNNISTYNKFRSEVILKFNKPLPAVNIKDDKDKQVPISEDCENIMDVLINKIIVNEAIQNFKR